MGDSVEVQVHDVKSILTSTGRDYLVRNNGDQVAINTLTGKKVGLFFSASWCGPCQRFTPNLVEVYNKLAPKDNFEIVFISADEDLESFNGYFSKMPWLAIPFSDSQTRESLGKSFKIDGIPHLVFLNETGKLFTDCGVEIISEYGSEAEAFPFTEERVAEIEAGFADMAKGWQDKVKSMLHEEHELVLTRTQGYSCDGCDEEGKVWGYSCEECNFDLHLECVFKESSNGKEVVEGWVCDGDVCYIPSN